MGYRHYFYKVDKGTLNKLHNFTKDQFYKWGSENNLVDSDDEELYLPLYKIGDEFFGFGKYYDNYSAIFSTGKPLFKDKELQERYEEYVPYIVGKEAVLGAIEYQKQLIVKYYEDMLLISDEDRHDKNFDDRPKEVMYRQHIQSMYREWKSDFTPNGCFAFDLDESNPAITTSWKYEYSIFELVRLYKSTDWEKYGLIFMGW